MEYFGLKLGQDLGNRAAHPYQEFRGVPSRGPEAFKIPQISCSSRVSRASSGMNQCEIRTKLVREASDRDHNISQFSRSEFSRSVFSRSKV